MKRLIHIVFLLFLSIYLSAQVVTTNVYFNTSAGVVVDYNDEYDTVLVAFTTDPHDTVNTKFNNLVQTLVDSSYWDRMDVLAIMACHTDGDDEYMVNWIDPGTNDLYLSDPANPMAFTAFEGVENAALAYLRSYIPSSAATHYAQNDGTIGIYLRTASIAEAYQVLHANSTYDVMMVPVNASNNFIARINNGTTDFSQANTTSNGLFIMTRTAANVASFYRNGTQLGADFTGGTSGVVDVLIGVLNGGAGRSTNQASIFFIMDGITDAEASGLNEIFEDFMDSLYTGVQ
jgi:hypothetical protein